MVLSFHIPRQDILPMVEHIALDSAEHYAEHYAENWLENQVSNVIGNLF